jgi:predicted TIM-barrel fold metal-dependent hydrolase
LEVLDAQLHDPGPILAWDHADEETRQNVLTELLHSMMESVGVDGALLFPSLAQEGWAEALSQEAPGRYAFVPRVNPGIPNQEPALDPEAPDVDERIAAARRRPGVAALRFVISAWPESIEKFESGAWDRALRACEEQRVPIFVFSSGRLDLVERLLDGFPALPVVIDHLGLKQPPLEPLDTPRWKELPLLLRLAERPNAYVKMCGAPGLSADAYPYTDVWEHVRAIVDAFGAERLMWASDISRFRGRVGWHMRLTPEQLDYMGQHTYAQSVGLYRDTDLLAPDEKSWVLGKSARTLLDWTLDGLAH